MDGFELLILAVILIGAWFWLSGRHTDAGVAKHEYTGVETPRI